jgi:hypothetical protein
MLNLTSLKYERQKQETDYVRGAFNLPCNATSPLAQILNHQEV